MNISLPHFVPPRFGLGLLVWLVSAANAAETAAAAPTPAADPKQRPPVVWNNAARPRPEGLSHHTLESAAMERTVGYCVSLPAGYDSGSARYPVVYFLHGAGGNETSDGEIARVAGRLAAAGEIPPAIFVLPNGGLSRYRDHPETKINVESMLIKELIPLIDRTYRTVPGRAGRMIAGYSMGGGAAVRLSLLYPHLFGAAGSMAGGLGGPGRAELPADLSLDAIRASRPHVRLLLVVGYKDEASYAAHAPLVQRLSAAEYPFTYRTLADVPHRLGVYNQLAGEDLLRFLLGVAERPAPR